jgi:hypothetical protein
LRRTTILEFNCRAEEKPQRRQNGRPSCQDLNSRPRETETRTVSYKNLDARIGYSKPFLSQVNFLPKKKNINNNNNK